MKLARPYLAREADFGTVLECSPGFTWRVEGRHETPHVWEVLGKQSIELPVPYQLHSEMKETNV